MKLSELIARLAEMLEEHGDIDVRLGKVGINNINNLEIDGIQYDETGNEVIIS
jgi:hypothetical protein